MLTTTLRTRLVRTGTAIALCAGVATGAMAITSPNAQATPSPAAKAPTVIFTEDFENGLADGQIALLTKTETIGSTTYDRYVGAGGEQYVSDPIWASIPACDGLVLDGNATPAQIAATGCTSGGSAHVNLSQMASVIGGGGDVDLNNHAVTAYTNTGSANYVGVEFATESNLPLAVNNRFITFSVDVGARCGNPPLLRFYLKDQLGNETPVGANPINPCSAPDIVGGTRIGSFAGDGAILFTGTDLGIVLRNEQATGSGNDHAFDNIRVLDATPELSKDAPAAQQGQAATLTFTITNTTELGAKPGWSFTDAFPAGVAVAADPNPGGTCTTTSFSPVAGAGSVSVTGDLLAGQASCTVSVDVVGAPGSYLNGPSNITSVGLDGPAGDTPIKFNVPPTVQAGPANGTTYAQGDTATVTFTCGDIDGTIVTCEASDADGPVASGTPIDTSVPGTYTFTVTAVDDDGGTTTVTHTITIRPLVYAGVCRGLVAGVLGIPLLGVANQPQVPCKTDASALLNHIIPLTPNPPLPLLGLPLLGANNVKLTVATSTTTAGAKSATATSEVASAEINLPVLGISVKAKGLHSEASSVVGDCFAPATTTATGTITTLVINGKTYPVGPDQYPVNLGLGTLYINWTKVTGNTVDRAALFLDLPGDLLDVYVAHSRAGGICL